MLPQYKHHDIIVKESVPNTDKTIRNDMNSILNEVNRMKSRIALLERENNRLKVSIEQLQNKK